MSALDGFNMSDQNQQTDVNIERIRIVYAFWLAVLGLAIAAVLVVFLVFQGKYESKDVLAVVGLFTSVLGTLVGAFFGLQVGSSGRESAQEAARDANNVAQRALAALPPEQARAVMGENK